MTIELFPESESSTLEFKAALPKYEQIVRTAIAFCNLYGGRIIIGVDDQRRIVGVDEQKLEEVILAIYSSVYESSTPAITPNIFSQRLGERMVIVAEISSGMNKPYFKTSEGMNRGTYIRLGPSTLRATAEIIDEIKWKARGKAFDQTPVHHAQISDLDQEKIKEFLENRPVGYKGKVTTELLKSYDIIVEEQGRKFPTVGAVLFFGKEPQKFFGEAMIIASEFSGSEMDSPVSSIDITGTITEQIEGALKMLTSRLMIKTAKRNIRRNSKLEIPLEGLREIVINAIAHRNYNIAGPIKIALFPDRIEIFSPGIFPGPLTIESLGNGVTYVRNAVLLKLLRESGYVEKLGSGFRILFKVCAVAHLRRPQVKEGTNFVKCTIFRTTAESNDHDQNIIAFIQDKRSISVSEVQSVTGFSRATASRYLARMVTQGKILRFGKGPGTKYRLTS